MKAFREENINALTQAILEDQYSDAAQIEAREEHEQSYTKGAEGDALLSFVKRNIKHPALEVGAGGGDYTIRNNIVSEYYLEPSKSRADRLTKLIAATQVDSVLKNSIQVIAGLMECIPDEIQDGSLECVLFLNGFWQVRSDYECLIEVNRVLAIGGRFIFNLAQNDDEDLICGRVIGYKNYLRILKEFGFEIYEARDEGFICVRKVKDFDPRDLRKLQLVKNESGSYEALNFFPDGRDANLL